MGTNRSGCAPMWSMVGTPFRVLQKTSTGACLARCTSQQAILDVLVALRPWEFNALRAEALTFTSSSRPRMKLPSRDV